MTNDVHHVQAETAGDTGNIGRESPDAKFGPNGRPLALPGDGGISLPTLRPTSRPLACAGAGPQQAQKRDVVHSRLFLSSAIPPLRYRLRRFWVTGEADLARHEMI